ncbi:protein LURP-one-related 8-like [Tasmannia lanceolata]|uniref:protein LURP-one-related 8-like n=1 Tax=Tasmannia lanceolata TaxID=3420 RepID=UPI00406492E3
MTKVYPNTTSELLKPVTDRHVEVLTAWRKSLLFNCHGFTVFDAKGSLLFRVDNYVAGNTGEIVLMDAAGKPLLAIRRKKLSLWDHWMVFDGETTLNPRFSVKRHVNFLNSNTLAHVTPCNIGSNSNKQVIYNIMGSYLQRYCIIYDNERHQVAEIKRKEAVGGAVFGSDIFQLVVQPDLDTDVAMSLVIVLDQMFSSRSLLRTVIAAGPLIYFPLIWLLKGIVAFVECHGSFSSRGNLLPENYSRFPPFLGRPDHLIRWD